MAFKTKYPNFLLFYLTIFSFICGHNFDRTVGINLQFHLESVWLKKVMGPQGRRQRGGSGARPPHLKSVSPHFTFGPPVAAYIQHCI